MNITVIVDGSRPNETRLMVMRYYRWVFLCFAHLMTPTDTPDWVEYSTTSRNENRVNENHLSFSQKNRNWLAWVLVALTVCFTYPVLYRVLSESRACEWELWVIDNEKSWSLRADARRRIILYYQTQVSLQETGSEPLGLGPSFSVENRNSLACLPG